MGKVNCVVCDKCEGTGYLIKLYRGKCYNAQRHVFSFKDGRRSEYCLRCGKTQGATADNNDLTQSKKTRVKS